MSALLRPLPSVRKVSGPAMLRAPGLRLPLDWVMLTPVNPLPMLLPAARLKACATVRVLVPVKLLSEPRFSVPTLADLAKLSEPSLSTRPVELKSPAKLAALPARMLRELPPN